MRLGIVEKQQTTKQTITNKEAGKKPNLEQEIVE